MLWYEHTITLKDCEYTEGVRDFCYELAKELQLNPVMYAEHPWPDDDSRDFIPGTTGVLVIETSHIAIHTCELRKTVMVQVVSCKPVDRVHICSAAMGWFNGSLKQAHSKEYEM